MKKKSITLIVLFLTVCAAFSQSYTSSSIFAHNDYVHDIPLYPAYYKQVGYIEADVFLVQGKLLVAHTSEEIANHRTLDSLYLKPLSDLINRNKGFAYADHTKTLTLMVDLKTAGVPTLDVLVNEIKKHPTLIKASNFQITVSGDMPDVSLWKNYPDFIHFDGRPGINYTPEQLARVSLISTSMQVYSRWNGKGVIPELERAKIITLIQQVHAAGKKIRFWGTPDFGSAWSYLMRLNVDILGTDNVLELSDFLKSFPSSRYQNTAFHEVYTPAKDHFKSKKTPKNVILLIGDGMGLTQLYSAYTANKGALSVFNIPTVGISVTASADNYITDSAAGATAMASGAKTNNRYIGVDSTGKPVVAITDKLKQKGYKTAIISAGDITDATPAAFYAHRSERGMSEAIASDFLATDNDILIGGGPKSFNKRSDGKDLFAAMRSKGYTVSTTFNTIDTIRNSKFVILDDAAVVPKMKGRGDFLSRSLMKSITTFTKGASPFFIMAEGAHIDHGGHDNNLEFVVSETLDFDEAIGAAMKFVDQNEETLLVVTADHETGGLSLPGGNLAQGWVQGHFSTFDHTAIAVPVFSYGPGADLFKGVYPNTELNARIWSLLSQVKTSKK